MVVPKVVRPSLWIALRCACPVLARFDKVPLLFRHQILSHKATPLSRHAASSAAGGQVRYKQ